eukprot:CAMPEP_0117001250 /NCGR_PEP_ID=MMETSP0472-20121206/3308_1 /TAXON_ID=693140 ORGANISM="Tiarina fusus, Strain LIS" /NCGR_SAMPLE_ID=MMETSP0472 /ASSEMBLY_ACC=CAM_ASM_000603 /LENGTH=128 /DNA_ID=CAMNT_0004701187 /DNA_START=231 /DNA_END=617 /DNA_ORIENTATION=+
MTSQQQQQQQQQHPFTASYSSTTPLHDDGSGSTAQEKLRALLEDYRVANYQQTIPTRFVKKIVQAADVNGDGFVESEEIAQFLENIGAGDKLTMEELAQVREEVQLKDPVPVDDLKDYLTKIFAKKKE